jgi:hypothetical protein
LVHFVVRGTRNTVLVFNVAGSIGSENVTVALALVGQVIVLGAGVIATTTEAVAVSVLTGPACGSCI